MVSPYFFENTTYWSEIDEASHFAWFDRIIAVERAYGVGRRVYLDLDPGRLDTDGLRELRAVYRRYGGDLGQLDGLRVEGSVG